MVYRKERQLWYNHRRSKSNPEMTTYFFVIVNTGDEIVRIEERIYDKFVSIAEEWEKLDGKVEDTDLKFKVIDTIVAANKRTHNLLKNFRFRPLRIFFISITHTLVCANSFIFFTWLNIA